MPFAILPLVRLSWLLAVSTASSATETPGNATAQRTRGQVRSPDPVIRQTLAQTTLRSATFAELVSCIENAQVFVYVVPAAHLRRGLSAALQLATTGGGGVRYLRIFVRPGARPAQQVGNLAHELAHVCEAVRAGAVVSNAALADYFRHHAAQGDRAARAVYETVAGYRAATAVVRELEQSGPAESVAAPTASVTFPRTGPAGTLLYSDAKALRNIGVLRFDPASGSVAGGLSPVTSGTNYWRRPHPSPDGEWVVAEAAERGIFIMRRDGSGLRRLTDHRDSDRAPRFSPDGRRVVFESDRSGSAGVWVVEADGRNLRRVTPVDPTRRWTLARWSPDGTRIAAWEQPAGRIVLFAADGSSAETATLLQLRDNEAERLAWYEWTPDGRQVALDLRDKIAVHSLETGESRTMPSPIGAGLISAWFPDSSRLLMNDYVNRRLIVLDVRTWRSTDAPYPAAVEGDATFGLSADGRTLAATHGTSTADIWMMRLPVRR